MGSQRECLDETDDAEIRRLELQHQSWRSSTRALWTHAGIGPGMIVIDAAAGAGFSSFDLSEHVGAAGRVIALERSTSLVMALTMMAQARGYTNIAVLQTDLSSYVWPEEFADAVCCRFALSRLRNPASVLRGMTGALKPGGVLVLQEPFDCRSWRLAPRSEQFESYVEKLMEDRRASGANPDIGLDLPRMLTERNMHLDHVQPLTFATYPGELAWQWRTTYVRNHVRELTAADVLSPSEAATIQSVLSEYETKPDAHMITSGVLQVVARKPR